MSRGVTKLSIGGTINFFAKKIYIYIYISERIKEDASILCYSEFHA